MLVQQKLVYVGERGVMINFVDGDVLNVEPKRKTVSMELGPV